MESSILPDHRRLPPRTFVLATEVRSDDFSQTVISLFNRLEDGDGERLTVVSDAGVVEHRATFGTGAVVPGWIQIQSVEE